MKAPPPIEVGENSFFQADIWIKALLICLIAMCTIILANLLRPISKQQLIQSSSSYKLQTQILITKTSMLFLFIFKKLEIQLLQFIIQSLASLGVIYSMMNKTYCKQPFQQYQSAQLNNQSIIIRTCSIIDQLKKLLIKISQKIQCQKQQFIKNAIFTQTKNDTQQQQSQIFSSSGSNQEQFKQKQFKVNQISKRFKNIRIRGYYKSILLILLIIAQLTSIKAQTPPPTCNSFPKIFGGTSGDSHLFQIDVYKDYLAIAGATYDYTLTGTSDCIPYVALQSISTGGKFNWAKAFTSKSWNSIRGVQFSTDGALLIVHSHSTSTFIVVFNVNNGSILSARSYSDGGYCNYNNFVKSMLVSSGASPMAYVLSNDQTTSISSSCTGQHLFKFDPLQSSSTSVWIKQTIVSSSSDDCGHLGLVFGRTESLLYAFSWYNGKSTVSLLDTNGNSQWQYSTPQGNSQKSNQIKYLKIDASTDMVIATSGSSYINYN